MSRRLWENIYMIGLLIRINLIWAWSILSLYYTFNFGCNFPPVEVHFEVLQIGRVRGNNLRDVWIEILRQWLAGILLRSFILDGFLKGSNFASKWIVFALKNFELLFKSLDPCILILCFFKGWLVEFLGNFGEPNRIEIASLFDDLHTFFLSLKP